MRFGLLFELGGPPHSSRADVKKIYDNALEQIRLADEIGFDHVWAVEHHFSSPHSYSTAPEVFLTAAAVMTKRIRVGHGIVVCVPPINHPAHIAERAAVLDIVSNGRVDIGTGRSNTWLELGGYGAEPHDTKQSWDEYVRALPKMWVDETFSHQGRFFSMPERAIVPKPLQDPHPPLWVAVTSQGTEYDAADRGLGVFGLSIGNYAAQEEKIRNYRKRIRQCEPIGPLVNEQVQIVNFMHCGVDGERASKAGRTMLDTFNHNTAHTVAVKEVYPSPLYQIGGFLPTLRQEALGPGDKSGIPEGLAIGDPDRIISVIKHWENIGVDGMNFVIQAAEVLPHEDVMESLRTFGKYVIPAFKSAEELAAPVGAVVKGR
ncbi:alkanesulfonate monooxygenase SsuD/methylene tetrahydromethanopterin reductase-like flavin-dependent oxidoreductase (luciferase family) [Thermocatellispora tengchongensis]|uniref:Alkanesulfonate monooxygenase SsuD/methylene tetrahydromethanopterin reductase-like flavin-dependent oxidoreductase (Luciferase family) n=1 Tax=Thermocatellispora tengchongensis TaxID=1073253 RepID=A0A840PB05_9ACTN|nr:LLM class flavin-dependent oxidoreductase [Thermocatellispora tengchongensis]MBB5136828.1 alkanesulfonate monooxygenase SsuD/methylene tetrahydromethanopterin reductase-like flavin-dependent oxidoreductase (luciferase family) [Thermocatellispora tengchongensis]